jgi:thiol-disulfide isomerase/thioredoxin
MDFQPYGSIVVMATFVAVMGILLRGRLAGRFVIPVWLAAGITGLATGLGLGCGSMHALGYRFTMETVPPFRMDPLSTFDQINRAAGDRPLSTGSIAPELQAGGWINTASRGAPDIEGRVVVLDVWADWCPMCEAAARSLTDVEEKYRRRGVVFITLTAQGIETAYKIANVCKTSGPIGYDAAATIEALVGVSPTVFVVGADGRIAWHDDRSRYKHDIDDLPAHLEQALETALLENRE